MLPLDESFVWAVPCLVAKRQRLRIDDKVDPSVFVVARYLSKLYFIEGGCPQYQLSFVIASEDGLAGFIFVEHLWFDV